MTVIPNVLADKLVRIPYLGAHLEKEALSLDLSERHTTWPYMLLLANGSMCSYQDSYQELISLIFDFHIARKYNMGFRLIM
ncbi:hypothetical protein J6590_060780 [Homalodisca vitripennis]|nr:hypothetical protein J6590_060780 [Homalodisca vitripennis]